MTEKEQLEKVASEVFTKERLDWVIASIEENRPAHTWDIEVELPDGRELLFSVPKGPLHDMKKSIKLYTEEELERIRSR